jgi:DNA repair protein RecN (Recombination protein N)
MSLRADRAEALPNVGFPARRDPPAELAGYLAGLDADRSGELEVVQERRVVCSGRRSLRRHGSRSTTSSLPS